MLALLGLLTCCQTGLLKDLGTAGTLIEVALGRQGEPIEGFIHLSPNCKSAYAQTPRWLTKGYGWQTTQPESYKKFVVAVNGWGAGTTFEWAWTDRPINVRKRYVGKIAGVVSNKQVLVYASNPDRGPERTYMTWLNPQVAASVKPMFVTNHHCPHPPVIRPDGKRIAVCEVDHWVLLSERGKVLKRIQYDHIETMSPSHRYAFADQEEIDLSTWRRQLVVPERGRGAVPYYWGDRLVLQLDGRYQLWDRKTEKLEDLRPYIPFLGSDISGRHILLQTDKTPNKMRSQTMITLR